MQLNVPIRLFFLINLRFQNNGKCRFRSEIPESPVSDVNLGKKYFQKLISIRVRNRKIFSYRLEFPIFSLVRFRTLISILFVFSHNIFSGEMRPNYSFILNYFVWVSDTADGLSETASVVDAIHGPLEKCPFQFALANLQSVVQRILQILFSPAAEFDAPPESCLAKFRNNCDRRNSLSAFCLSICSFCMKFNDWRYAK